MLLGCFIFNNNRGKTSTRIAPITLCQVFDICTLNLGPYAIRTRVRKLVGRYMTEDFLTGNFRVNNLIRSQRGPFLQGGRTYVCSLWDRKKKNIRRWYYITYQRTRYVHNQVIFLNPPCLKGDSLSTNWGEKCPWFVKTTNPRYIFVF